jgi:hypothetical protein
LNYAAGYGGPRSPLLPLVAAFAGGPLALWLGATLVRRRIPPRYLLVFVGVSVALAVGLTTVMYPDLPAWQRLGGVGVGPLVLLVYWRSLARWLPPRAVRSKAATLAEVNQVWWRRRVAGLFALMAAVATVLILALASATPDDQRAVRETLARYEQAINEGDVGMFCKQFATSYIDRLASNDLTCESAYSTLLVDAGDVTLDVLSVKISDSRARARIRISGDGPTSEGIFALAREAGAWHIEATGP